MSGVVVGSGVCVCVFGGGVTMCLHDFDRIDFLIPKKYFSKQTSYTEFSPFLVMFSCCILRTVG